MSWRGDRTYERGWGVGGQPAPQLYTLDQAVLVVDPLNILDGGMVGHGDGSIGWAYNPGGVAYVDIPTSAAAAVWVAKDNDGRRLNFDDIVSGAGLTEVGKGLVYALWGNAVGLASEAVRTGVLLSRGPDPASLATLADVLPSDMAGVGTDQDGRQIAIISGTGGGGIVGASEPGSTKVRHQVNSTAGPAAGGAIRTTTAAAALSDDAHVLRSWDSANNATYLQGSGDWMYLSLVTYLKGAVTGGLESRAWILSDIELTRPQPGRP